MQQVGVQPRLAVLEDLGGDKTEELLRQSSPLCWLSKGEFVETRITDTDPGMVHLSATRQIGRRWLGSVSSTSSCPME